MPGLNLTRDEARTRSALLTVDTYDIDLDFTTGGDTFDSVTVIRFAAAAPGEATFVDLVATHVREIVLNGRALDPDEVYADGRVTLDGLAETNEVRIAADCAYSNSGQGLHRTIDAADGRTYLYTHFEVPDARRLYASFEQPDLKASFRFTITAPAGWTVLSNSPTPDPTPAGERAATWAFEPTPRMSTYITAVAAGDYHIVHDTHTTADGTVIPMAVACRTSLAAHLDPDRIFGIVKKGFDYYIEKFGRPYPFAKYDQIFVPEYNIGAMENVGLVTVVERYVFQSRPTDADHHQRANTLLHELAHMWFGDLVTMRWWDDLWLKESFATYMAFRCLADITDWPSWTDFANSEKAWGLRQDQLPTTHPIVADIRDLEDVSVNFDGITYAKGGAVLKQLVAWVGSDEFFAGAKHYFDTYEWGNTTLADLLGALEKTSGRDLTAWSRQWLETAGPNTLRPAYTLDADGRFAAFTVEQTAPESRPTLRSHRIAIGLYTLADGRMTRTSQVTVDVVGATTPVPELIGIAAPDLVLINDDDLTYAKIRFDDRSMARLRAYLGAIDDSLARALCWAALWDMVRGAELPARDYIAIVLGAIDGEDSIGVVEDLHATLRAALDRYVDPDAAAAERETVAGAARAHAAAAAPGGDEQLAWTKLLIHVANSDHDVATVAGLLDGTHTIDGLDVDFDLRWMCVAALARLGKIDDAEIEAELARDRTTAADGYAAGARAARPTADAKAAAWAIISEPDVPKRVLDAIGGARVAGRFGLGFGQPGHEDLVAAYVERYFEALPRVWSERTVENARSFVSGMYPSSIVTPETISRTDAFLAHTSVASALRRLLLESRDEVVRALAARELDRR